MVYFLQDFEALTPNLLARTVETVEGGGLVVLLLRTMSSLKQLYTMAMVCVFLWPFIELNCNQYFNKLMSIFHASILVLIMNFITILIFCLYLTFMLWQNLWSIYERTDAWKTDVDLLFTKKSNFPLSLVANTVHKLEIHVFVLWYIYNEN